MYIDPRHLAQLSLIVEAGSFQAAADRIGITQPALSRNMKTLEDRVGIPLFDRSSRKAEPTDLGLKLAQAGISIRTAEEQARNLSKLAAEGTAGTLRIGAPPIIAGHFLTSRITRFIVDRPHCKVDLRVGLVHELREMLERAQVDMIIGPRDFIDRSSQSTFTHLVDDRVGVLCRSGHALHSLKTIKSTDLQHQRWVSHSRGSMLRHQTEGALIAMGLDRIDIAVETDSIRSVMEILQSTDFISTMPMKTTAAYLGDDLAFLKLDHPQFHRPIGIISRNNESSSPIHNEFQQLCLQH